MIRDERFLDFFHRLMKYEGGYVFDQDDPGGETKFGISKRAYPDENILALTETRAMELYHRDYYLKMRIPEMTDARVAWQIFDFGVNAGTVRAARMIQKIVGAYPDGVIGKTTIAYINRFKGDFPLYIFYRSERVKYYCGLTDKNPRNIKYLKGWLLRALEV